jgi:truncated hemoglobin YjbI
MDNARFEASYARLFGESVGADESADAFFEAFYQRFLSDDGIAELFRGTDMRRQAAMLRKSFFHLAGFYVTSSPSGELERMARVHYRLGIGAELYDVWLDSLIATVAEFDPECDEATELAWRLALMPGVTYMKLYDHFQQAR